MTNKSGSDGNNGEQSDSPERSGRLPKELVLGLDLAGGETVRPAAPDTQTTSARGAGGGGSDTRRDAGAPTNTGPTATPGGQTGTADKQQWTSPQPGTSSTHMGTAAGQQHDSKPGVLHPPPHGPVSGQSNRNIYTLTIVAVCIVGVALIFALAGPLRDKFFHPSSEPLSAGKRDDASGITPSFKLPSLPMSAREVFDRAKHSVVMLAVLQRASARVGARGSGPKVSVDVAGGKGSGFFVAPDIVATNYHVIVPKDRVVTDIEIQAKITSRPGLHRVTGVIEADPDKDLALLYVPGTGAPPLPLVRNPLTEMHVGDKVFAVGSPLGQEGTITDGIISYEGWRKIRVRPNATEEEFLQHSAPINPGNSGGPLLNDRCEVVGVNTAAPAESQSMSLAVPAKVLAKMLDRESVQRKLEILRKKERTGFYND